MQTKQIIWTIIVLVALALVALGVFYFSPQEAEAPVGEEPVVYSAYTEAEPLVVVHSFESGIHTYSATIQKPTPCHTLSAQGLVMESFPEQFGIDITISNPDPDTVCVQVVDQEAITMEFSGDERALLTIVHINSAPIPFEIFEESKG